MITPYLPAGDVWPLNIYFALRVVVRNMIADSSKPNKLRNVYTPREARQGTSSSNQRTNDAINAHSKSGICDLILLCPKIGQVHPRVMIYTNVVELHCLMLQAKFQNHRPSGSGEENV